MLQQYSKLVLKIRYLRELLWRHPHQLPYKLRAAENFRPDVDRKHILSGWLQLFERVAVGNPQ
jgi:hypothetical protein